MPPFSKLIMKDHSTLTKSLDIPTPGLIQPAAFQPKPVLSHIPLANPGAYYRSKIFSTTTSTNLLTAASATLLILIASLRTTPSRLDSRELYLHLVHEIKSFETQAQTSGYRAESILLARYMLCATLDEAILSTHWDKQEEWRKHKLLSCFHGEECGDERFFLILDRLSADPVLHIDLLELAYLCLSLGFTGKYQRIENGKIELDELVERLYQLIRWQRGAIKKELALMDAVSTESAPAPVVTTAQPLPLWLLGVLTFLLIISVYIGFNFMLGGSITPVYQQLNRIVQTYAEN